MLNKKCIQMEMNFNGNASNRFRERLENGVFQVLAEITAPSADTKLEYAAGRFSDFEYVAAAAAKTAAGLAFLNAPGGAPEIDPVAFAAALCKNTPDAHVIYLSGRGRSSDEVLGEAKHALAGGFKNFCAVSGNVPRNMPEREIRRISFLESVNVLRRLKEDAGKELFCGATVNPFSYTGSDCCSQYFKAVKKINCGAGFLVSQFGWDMRKLQELRWYFWRRGIQIPLFGRILYLTPDRAANVCSGKIPGIHVSPDFERALQREIRYSNAQFEAAQLRRIQIHAAGARYLGYSGIQLAGVDSPELLETLLSRIGDALEEFQTFDDWRCAYDEYYARLDMAPYPYRFYLFKDLLSSAQPPEEFVMNDAEIPPCSSGEKMLYRLSELLFSHAAELPASERRLTKKLLLSCRSCKKCRLPKTFYLCPEVCPKGMSNGPCGASQADGKCGYADEECIFNAMLRLANSTRDYLPLENVCIASPEERPR